MPSLYPDLSDEKLLERLLYMATAEQCEFVEEERKGEWLAAFKRFDEPSNVAPDGVIVRGAESADRRAAREHLLYRAEQRL
jgi:hypothetical protein